MRHILTPEESQLRAMVRWSAPNLVCFTRASRPPIASLVVADVVAENEETDSCEESASGAKQELRGMSSKSSLAVARVLSTIVWAKLGRCLHVTLTYWRAWPDDKAKLAREKQRLCMWFNRNADCGVWRLEFHKPRKTGQRVPHWHVLAFVGNRDVDTFMAAVRGWWAASAENGGSAALYANGSEEAVHFSDGDGRASWYFALHAAKREQAPPFRVGRWWGFVNRDVLLDAQRIHPAGEVLNRERVWWSRIYRRSTGCRTRNEGGFSWFLSEVGQTKVASWVCERCAHEAVTRSNGGTPY